MKKLIYITLFTFSILLFPYPVSAFTDNFNVTIDEELITIAGKPGNTYTTTINIETMNATQTVHLFGLSLPATDSYSTTSWITPAQTTANITNQTPTTLTFTLTIPSSATAGEYYQSLAVSDKPFNDTETADPTTLVAVPIIIQVSSDASESTTTTSTSSSDNTTDTSTTSTTPSTATKTGHAKPTPTKTLPKPTTSTLFSKLKLITLKSSFNIYKLQTNFWINIKNEGNIYSIPTGSIQVTTLKNNVLQNIPLITFPKTLLPQKETVYQLLYKGPLYAIGIFKAQLNLISTDTQTTNPKPITTQIYFFHLSPVPAFLIIIIVLLLLSKTKNKRIYLAICLLLLLFLVLISQQDSPKFLSDTQNLDITAQVKTQIGLKSIINNDLSKTILFTSTNSLGSTLFSLQNGSRTSLEQVAQYTYGSFTTNLSYPQDSLPLMMITTGY